MTMPVGVPIASFDRQTEAENDCFSRVEFVGIAFESGERSNARFQFCYDGRFRKKIIGACLYATNAILTLG